MLIELILEECLFLVRGTEQQCTKFNSIEMTNTCVDNTDNNDDNDVPPAVMRSLRNIRRDVVVDLEGRNVLR